MNNAMMIADQLGSLDLPVVEVSQRIENGVTVGMFVTFENRMVLSIQWHGAAYSNVGRGCWEPGEEPTVEAAAWYPEEFDEPYEAFGYKATKRRWFNPDPRFSGDDVLPYVTIPQVIEFARKVAAVELNVAN